MNEPAPAERPLRLRRAQPGDRWWLLRAGLDPEKVGRQYHWAEAPLQLWIAPARALRAPRAPAAVVEVDGRPAGYVGPNPLSGKLEYFLAPWARGGVGRRLVAAYLAGFRAGDRARAFHVSRRNERSLRTLLGALDDLGWQEGRDHHVVERRRAWVVRVRAEPGGAGVRR